MSASRGAERPIRKNKRCDRQADALPAVEAVTMAPRMWPKKIIAVMIVVQAKESPTRAHIKLSVMFET